MPNPLSSLPPSVEARLAAWEHIQFGLARPAQTRLRPTITLSRQFGCEAFLLAERLQARLAAASGEAWSIFDHALLEKVAHDEGLSMRLLQDLGNRSRALEGLGLIPKGEVAHDVAFQKVAKALVALAVQGNAVIVGRGGAVLCHELKNCYHFRLEASLAHRVASIQRRLEVPRAEAEEIVKTRSKMRDEFIRQTLKVDLGESRHYDAVFNGERHTLDAIADAIVAYVRAGWEDKAYFHA